jgi:hypothetical protein
MLMTTGAPAGARTTGAGSVRAVRAAARSVAHPPAASAATPASMISARVLKLFLSIVVPSSRVDARAFAR